MTFFLLLLSQRVYVFDVESSRVVAFVDGHDNDVNAVTYMDNAPDIIASGSDDNLIKASLASPSSQFLISFASPIGCFIGRLSLAKAIPYFTIILSRRSGIGGFSALGDAAGLWASSWGIRKASRTWTARGTAGALTRSHLPPSWTFFSHTMTLFSPHLHPVRAERWQVPDQQLQGPDNQAVGPEVEPHGRTRSAGALQRSGTAALQMGLQVGGSMGGKGGGH